MWISSATVLQRANVAAELAFGEKLGQPAEPLQVLKRFEVEGDGEICGHYARMLLGRQPSEGLQRRLVDFYSEVQGDRSAKVRRLLHLIMTLPEFQLM